MSSCSKLATRGTCKHGRMTAARDRRPRRRSSRYRGARAISTSRRRSRQRITVGGLDPAYYWRDSSRERGMPTGRKMRSGRARTGGYAAALLGAALHAAFVPARADSPDAALEKEQRCLALAMYFEARSEGPEGMRAVGSVVLNRVESDQFPPTPCEVVHEGGETPPCQF